MSSSNDNLLFAPLDFGNFQVSHRIALAPMTRNRATKEHVPSEMTLKHYSQRAATPGTFLITEATLIAQRAGGLPNVPGIWNDEQIKAWRKITDEVHSKGSFIYLQIWAFGRGAHPEVVKAEGLELVGASAIPMSANDPTPRALTLEEIQEYKESFGQAAENAIIAGFDGIEIHAANGYLPDQFIQDVSNQRTDIYGGSIENRARFVLEVVQTIADKIGAQRTAIRLSPFSDYQGMKMTDPVPQFKYIIEQLALHHPDLSYIHLIEPRIGGVEDGKESLDFARDAWRKTGRPFLSAGGFTRENAIEHMSQEGHENEVVVFGRHFTSNPDLVERIRKDIPFTPYDRNTFYDLENPKGYIDWPTAEEQKTQQQELKLSLN